MVASHHRCQKLNITISGMNTGDAQAEQMQAEYRLLSILGSKSLEDGAMPHQVEIQERPALLIVLFCMENGHI